MNISGITNEEKVDKASYFSIEKAIKHIENAHKKLKMRSSFYYNPTVDAVLIQSEAFFILQGMKPDVYFSTIDFRRFKILFDDFAYSLKVIGKKVAEKSNVDTRPAEIDGLIKNCCSSYMRANKERLEGREDVDITERVKKSTGYDKEPSYVGDLPEGLPKPKRIIGGKQANDQGMEQ